MSDISYIILHVRTHLSSTRGDPQTGFSWFMHLRTMFRMDLFLIPFSYNFLPVLVEEYWLHECKQEINTVSKFYMGYQNFSPRYDFCSVGMLGFWGSFFTQNEEESSNNQVGLTGRVRWGGGLDSSSWKCRFVLVQWLNLAHSFWTFCI